MNHFPITFQTGRSSVVRGAILFISLCLSLSFGAPRKPAWVMNRPVAPDYYIGIGIADKGRHMTDFMQAAKNKALQAIASEISVKIENTVLQKISETNAAFKESYESVIRTSAQENLEGYELVDSWDSGSEYWVYYRLSKSGWARQQKIKQEAVLGLVADLMLRGERALVQKRHTEALRLNLQALRALIPYIHQNLQVNLDGRQATAANELHSRLGRLFGSFKFVSPNPIFTGSHSRLLEQTPGPGVVFMEGQEPFPVDGMPVRFSTVKGSSRPVPRGVTGADGRVLCRFDSVSMEDARFTMGTALDLERLTGLDTLTPFLRTYLAQFALPSEDLVFVFTGLPVLLVSSELNLELPLNMAVLEPVAKRYLSERGIHFVADVSNAQRTVKLEAATRKGNEAYNICFAFADVTVSVYEGDREIFKTSLAGVKGGQLDFEKAGLEAFKNAKKRLEDEVLPKVLEHLQGL